MRRIVFLIAICSLISISSAFAQNAKPSAAPQWALNATIIEACSCPMFCPCYFNTQPAAHTVHDGHGAATAHFCRANFAYRVNKGNYGNVRLDGVKFWLAGDLGGDFSKAQTDWIEATFEPSVTKEQRQGLAVILSHVYPFKWKSFTVAEDATVDWQATKDRAEARLDGGKKGELVLKRYPGVTDDSIVITNLRYFGAARNTGFILMPNEVEAYRVGSKPFEYRGTNGFMITIDITSKDIK
ncbi:MAG: DUF1326 domain-containing protein [Acidobacteriota bacterium]